MFNRIWLAHLLRKKWTKWTYNNNKSNREFHVLASNSVHLISVLNSREIRKLPRLGSNQGQLRVEHLTHLYQTKNRKSQKPNKRTQNLNHSKILNRRKAERWSRCLTNQYRRSQQIFLELESSPISTLRFQSCMQKIQLSSIVLQTENRIKRGLWLKKWKQGPYLHKAVTISN